MKSALSFLRELETRNAGSRAEVSRFVARYRFWPQRSNASTEGPARWLRILVPLAAFGLTVAIRIPGVSRHFWMLGDQIRDWAIALRPIQELPLVGPPTHVGGYTIGPAFYWILWVIRVVVGPWFQNLPHAGGIGQSLLQSGVDALFVMAVWKRTRSLWLAMTAGIILVTAPFDLSLAPTIWNPVVGSILAKAATALILLEWHRGSLRRAAVTAAIAWCAVHAYTGAIFAALGIFAALVVDECFRRDWRIAGQRALVIASVVAALQIPYLIHQFMNRSDLPAMGAVTYSIGHVVSGQEPLRTAASARAYMDALTLVQGIEWDISRSVWTLIGCALALTIGWWRQPSVLAVTLLPQALAVGGYALWLGDLQAYYYLSLMPAAVLTILMGPTAVLPLRLAQLLSLALFVAALQIVPARLSTAATMVKMPSYEALVAGSREIIKRKLPMRSIDAAFELHPTSDASFVFRILGGRVDPEAEWRAVILPDGRVMYER